MLALSTTKPRYFDTETQAQLAANINSSAMIRCVAVPAVNPAQTGGLAYAVDVRHAITDSWLGFLADSSRTASC